MSGKKFWKNTYIEWIFPEYLCKFLLVTYLVLCDDCYAWYRWLLLQNRKLGTSTSIGVPKRTLRAWTITDFKIFEILKDSFVSYMLFSRFSPRRYFESGVSFSHNFPMLSFKRCLSVLYILMISVCARYPSS